jgi:hypothetical protein
LAEPPSDNIWGYRNDKKDEEENNGNVVIKYPYHKPAVERVGGGRSDTTEYTLLPLPQLYALLH